MSRQMLSSKEPLSAPWLGAGMFPGHGDAVRVIPYDYLRLQGSPFILTRELCKELHDAITIYTAEI